MFYRWSDGTSMEGHVCFKDEPQSFFLEFKFDKDGLPPLEQVYRVFGTCSALKVSTALLWGYFDPLYEFLYGNSLEAFNDWSKKPKRWTENALIVMNWELFCRSYYTFLCSKEGFSGDVWGNLRFAFNAFKQQPELLAFILKRHNRSASAADIADFWETVYGGVEKKLLRQLSEKTCHDAFVSLEKIKGFLPTNRYQALLQDCCTAFDKIARARIEEACAKTYTARELVDFNIEEYFFYEEYFSLPCANETTKEYVLSTVFRFLISKGDKIRAANAAIEADNVYTAALKYAQSSAEKELVFEKRSEIATSVNKAKEEVAKQRAVAQLEREKEKSEKERREKRTEFVAKVMVTVFLASILAAIIFGIMMVVGASEFSKVGFMVSVCIAAIFIIILVIEVMKDKRH